MGYGDEGMNIFQAAGVADAFDPDSRESIAAKWLEVVISYGYDLRAEAARGEFDEEDLYDRVHEVADSVVPIYTYKLWMTWVELGGYQYENDLGSPEDMFPRDTLDRETLEKLPQWDLYDMAVKIINEIVGDKE